MTNPTALQRLEGFLLLGAAIWMFAETGESWWLFGLLLLAPDVSMLGYLRGAAPGGQALAGLVRQTVLKSSNALDGSAGCVLSAR